MLFFLQVNDHHMETTLPIDYTNATGTYLHHLNDDCLLEIFSQHSLSLMDLLSLSETCELFKRIAQRVFPGALTIYKDYPEYSIASKDYVRKIASAHNVERILKNFGRHLVALRVNSYGPTIIMNLVAKHCVVGTLKELEIEHFTITEDVAVELQSIFGRLQKFTCYKASIDCDADVFANCDSLTELSVTQPCNGQIIMENYFPKLQRFTFEGYKGNSLSTLFNFLERHKTLKCQRLHAHSSSRECAVHCEDWEAVAKA